MAALISPTQHSLLVAMQQGVKVVMTFGPNRNKASLARPGFPGVTSSVLALEQGGWIERFNLTAHGCEFRLTRKAKAKFTRQSK